MLGNYSVFHSNRQISVRMERYMKVVMRHHQQCDLCLRFLLMKSLHNSHSQVIHHDLPLGQQVLDVFFHLHQYLPVALVDL